MDPLTLLRFALQALRGHGLRSTLSLVGVAIGVAAVVVLTALGEGARRYVMEQFASIGTNLLIIAPGRTETTGAMPGVGGAANDLTLGDAEAIARQIPAVARVAPMSMGTEVVASGARSRQVAIVGSTATFATIRKLHVAQGSFLPEDDASQGAAVAVLGQRVARELFPDRPAVGEVVRIGGWRMRVIGVLASRGVQVGIDIDEVVLVPVATGMKMFNRSSLFRLMAEVHAHADLPAAREAVRALLAERHGEDDVTVLTQDSVVATLSTILGVLTLALVAIASISLSVAGIGIMNVMLVAVSERSREVGLLRAVGAHRHQIVAVFLTEAALLSSAGGLVGLAVGQGMVRLLVGIFPALPASAPGWAVAAALATSVLVGVVFGVLPARRAAFLDPVLALARR
jgi:putative ABC transport system permease protein